jgi:hypothetical protein
VYFGFGVADGRPSAVAVQVLSAGAFLTRIVIGLPLLAGWVL